MRRIPVKATMDSDAWRPFDPVDVKRQVGPGRGAQPAGSRRTISDYIRLDVSVVTLITLTTGIGA
jgi:hypothetical protein